jgi:hypothetical protein
MARYRVARHTFGAEYPGAWEKHRTHVDSEHARKADAIAACDATACRATVYDNVALATVHDNGRKPGLPTRRDLLRESGDLLGERLWQGRPAVAMGSIRVRAARREWGWQNRVSIQFVEGGGRESVPAGEWHKSPPTGREWTYHSGALHSVCVTCGAVADEPCAPGCQPVVCPGCYAVDGPCEPGCPDAEAEDEREDELARERLDREHDEPEDVL